jgi:DNA-binding CsgD family transcriptional regulator/tetratricopeptide (TPR) repeat protein
MIVSVARRLSSPTLIGRHQERAWLGDLLNDSRSDRTATILIGGEAGVGKTRLVTEFAERADADGWRVLVGHCLELGESGLPFAPIVEAFRGLPDLLDPDVLARVLGSGRAEIGNLVPSLAEGSAPAEARPADEATQARLFEFILAMIGRLAAEAPVVLEIEDLHWADRSTRDLLRFLARNLRQGPLLMVATFRTDELHRRHPLVPFLAEFGRLPRVERSDLSRLNAEETHAQLSAILGHAAAPDLARGIHERSDGNPFFAEELLAAAQAARATMGRSGIPPDLETLLNERVGRLSDATQAVLGVAAAAGRDVSHLLLERIAELSKAQLLAALREAIEQQVLVVVESETHDPRYSFRHALIQEAIYSRLLPTERLRLHRRIVDALLDGVGGGETAAALGAEVAHHADRAGDPIRALHWSVVAGDAATAVAAFAEAYLHLERALHHWSLVAEPETVAGVSRVGLLARTAAAAAAIGEPAVAAGLAGEAIELFGSDGDAEQRAILVDRRFLYLWESGDLPGAAAAVELALGAISTIDAPAARTRLIAALGHARIHQGRFLEADVLLREAHAAAEQNGNYRAAAEAFAMMGFSLCYQGLEEEGIAQLRDAMGRLAGLGDDQDQLWLAASNLEGGLGWAGRHREALDMLREGLDQLRRDGTERRWGPMLVSGLIDHNVALGQWDAADRVIAEAALPDHETLQLAWFHWSAAELDALRGKVAAARARMEIAERLVGVGPGSSRIDRLFMLRGEVAILHAEGQHRDARLAIEAAIGRSGDPQREAMLWWLFAFGARCCADEAEDARAHGRDDLATVTAARATSLAGLATKTEARAIAEGRGAATLSACTRLATAEAGRAQGRSDPAAWEASARAFASLEQPIDEAYARYRRAEAMLALRGDRKEIATLLRAVHATSTEVGAQPLAADAIDLARRARISLVDDAGTTPARSEPDPWNLTGREREVLGLLAIGLTNREIGERLFVTEKTASVHVSNILGKLGVAGRGAAAAMAVRLGIVPAVDAG